MYGIRRPRESIRAMVGHFPPRWFQADVRMDICERETLASRQEPSAKADQENTWLLAGDNKVARRVVTALIMHSFSCGLFWWLVVKCVRVCVFKLLFSEQ